MVAAAITINNSSMINMQHSLNTLQYHHITVNTNLTANTMIAAAAVLVVLMTTAAMTTPSNSSRRYNVTVA
jgi:hypothetical protein